MTVEQELTRTLGRWAVGSLLAGVVLSASPRTRSFGRQTAAWGAARRFRPPRRGTCPAMTHRTLSEALEGLRFAMVATADPSSGGTWKSRPLALAGQRDGVLCFLVGADADWVQGLEQAGSPTTVTFSDPGQNTWVALQGSARTTDDRALVQELWNVAAGAYFDGKDDPSVRVLEVSVDYGEFWDGPSGRLGQALSLAKSALGGRSGDQGDIVT